MLEVPGAPAHNDSRGKRRGDFLSRSLRILFSLFKRKGTHDVLIPSIVILESENSNFRDRESGTREL